MGLVVYALIDNPEGIYKVGVPLGAEPPHTPLQGEVGAGTSVVGTSTNSDRSLSLETGLPLVGLGLAGDWTHS